MKFFETTVAKPNKLTLFGVACAAVLAGVLFTHEGNELRAQNAKPAKAAPAAQVSVATVVQQTVAVRVQAIGNVEAYATVALKARVDGQIVEVNFKEGQKVRRGAVLFRIDPRPFEVAMRQAEANLMRDTAQMEQTRSQERRYQELLQKNFVSREAYAQIRTNAETAAAVVQASKAAVDNARLQLGYCSIRSPLDGFVGKVMLQKGNLAKANDSNPLVVINQMQPIYVNFAVPEKLLATIRDHMAKDRLTVDARAPDSDQPAAVGTLSFVDNAVDAATGTIRLKAVFPNKDSALWPGQFVNISLRLYEQKDALVVPAQAVQAGPKGQYVYVINADMRAEVRKIELDRIDGDNAIVASGLNKGETVVVKGQLRLAPGAKVVIAEPTTAKP
ncbi:MAG: efflux RND transporter periplasmic adaptor subunit [Burkholderiales bacterium]|nr:efflux RND transporter periplasmic adaptor subunit [Burkholderiales bacterium]